MMTTHHSKYGLWQFGNGTGVYKPVSPNTRLETAIQSDIIKALKLAYPNGVVIKMQATQYTRAGIPDIHMTLDGRSIWIEVKRPGADTTALQVKALENLRNAGAYVGTAENVETALNLVKGALSWEIRATYTSLD